MTSVHQALQQTEASLAAAGIDQAQAEARHLLECLLAQSKLSLHKAVLTVEQQTCLQSWLRRRLGGEPVQHITELAWFYGLPLKVSPQVLIPRPETEVLVSLVLERIRGLQAARVLDVGTGSGAIALAIQHERRDTIVMASDLSAEALELARHNAAQLGLEVSFVQADLLSEARVLSFTHSSDVLVANLPYLPESDFEKLGAEVKREPAQALFAGEDGLAVFRRLLSQARSALKVGSWAAFELDPRNLQSAWAMAADWSVRHCDSDLLGRERFLLLER